MNLWNLSCFFLCFSYRSYLIEAPHSPTTVPSRFIAKHGFEACLMEAVSRENSPAVYNTYCHSEAVRIKNRMASIARRAVSLSLICFSLSLFVEQATSAHKNRILYIYASVRGFKPEPLCRMANRISINGSRWVSSFDEPLRYSFNG